MLCSNNSVNYCCSVYFITCLPLRYACTIYRYYVLGMCE